MGVSVRHNARLAALVGLVAAVMTVVWFSRALQSESAGDWAWCAVVALVGVLQLLVLRDSRAPLMVADEHGVRVRRGETWSGLRWQDIEHVDVQSPRSWWRDGRVVVHPRPAPAPGELVDEPATVDIQERGETAPDGEAYVVPLARTTRVKHHGMTGDLVADLESLASGRVPVVVLSRLEAPEAAPDESVEQPVEQEPVDADPGQADHVEAGSFEAGRAPSRPHPSSRSSSRPARPRTRSSRSPVTRSWTNPARPPVRTRRRT